MYLNEEEKILFQFHHLVFIDDCDSAPIKLKGKVRKKGNRKIQRENHSKNFTYK